MYNIINNCCKPLYTWGTYVCTFVYIYTFDSISASLHAEGWHWKREEVWSVVSLCCSDVHPLCNPGKYRQRLHSGLVPKHNVCLQTARTSQQHPPHVNKRKLYTCSLLATFFISLTCLPQRVLGWDPNGCCTEISPKSTQLVHWMESSSTRLHDMYRLIHGFWGVTRSCTCIIGCRGCGATYIEEKVCKWLTSPSSRPALLCSACRPHSLDLAGQHEILQLSCYHHLQ